MISITITIQKELAQRSWCDTTMRVSPECLSPLHGNLNDLLNNGNKQQQLATEAGNGSFNLTTMVYYFAMK